MEKRALAEEIACPCAGKHETPWSSQEASEWSKAGMAVGLGHFLPQEILMVGSTFRVHAVTVKTETTSPGLTEPTRETAVAEMEPGNLSMKRSRK